MADKTLMSSIAENVSKIEKSHSKFGTKLPGNKSKERELTLQELSYEQMIMGTLASLTWGVKNIDKDTQIKTLLGKQNIFGLIKDINSKLESEKTIFTELKKYSKANATILQYFYDNLPKTITDSANAIINAIGKSKKNKESLKDSTTKILIDLKAADTIEQILKDFDALEGVVIFDNDNVNHVQDLLDRLDKLSKENIYLVIDTNLYDTIKELKELKIDIYDPTCLDSIKAEIDNLNNQKIEIFDTDNIDKARNLFEQIQKIKFDAPTENILTALKNFVSAIENSKFDNVKDKDTLEQLTKFFVDDKGSINTLLLAIAKLDEDNKLNQDKFEILSKAFEIINIASKLMEGHDVKINKRFFKDLNSVLTEESYIKGLINHLNDLAIDVKKNVRDNIQTVDDFITTVSNLGNLGFIKLIKAKIAIKAINAFLVKDIKSLIDNVSEYKTVKEDTDKTFEALDHLFDSIVKLGDITISDKRKMAKNIIFIDKFLSEDIKNIIEKSIPSLDKNQKEGFEVLEKTKGIIDSLISIADIDEQKLGIASEKIDAIKDFITDDVNELLKFIAENLGPKKELKKIIEVTDLTREIFENIEDMNESIPSIMSLLKSNIKVVLLATEFAFIEESFKTLAKLSKILKPKDKQFLSKRFDGTLDSIIEINGVLASINTKQGIKDILALDNELAYMYWCMDFMKEIAESYTKVLKFNEFKKTIQNIKSVIDSIEISKEDYKKLGALTALLNTMYTLGQYASDKTTFDIEKFDEATEAILTGAIPFISEFVKDSELDKNLQNLMSVNDKMLDKFDQIIKLIEKFDKLSKIAVLSKISNIGLKGIVKEAEYIKVIIGKFGDIDNKEIYTTFAVQI